MKAVLPDDQGFTTIEHIRDGLAAYGKLDRDIIHDTEWVRTPSPTRAVRHTSDVLESILRITF